jgi:lyso-ornithine lipid O-acyltransferase
MWEGQQEPPTPSLNLLSILVGVVKGVSVLCLVLFGMSVLMLVRLIEYPVFRQARPVTPYITKFVCRSSLFLIGVRCRVKGTPMLQRGIIVSNHASWLDIFALNAFQKAYFVSKAEVSSWPLIGQLAHATGTLFVERNPRKSVTQLELFEKRLGFGHQLLFFPEGTSSDGLQVLPFKSTLFAALFNKKLKSISFAQPVSLYYEAPAGQDERFYGWWGDMVLGRHLLLTLATIRHGTIHITFSEPVAVVDFPSRKELAQALETTVVATHEAARASTRLP